MRPWVNRGLGVLDKKDLPSIATCTLSPALVPAVAAAAAAALPQQQSTFDGAPAELTNVSNSNSNKRHWRSSHYSYHGDERLPKTWQNELRRKRLKHQFDNANDEETKRARKKSKKRKNRLIFLDDEEEEELTMKAKGKGNIVSIPSIRKPHKSPTATSHHHGSHAAVSTTTTTTTITTPTRQAVAPLSARRQATSAARLHRQNDMAAGLRTAIAPYEQSKTCTETKCQQRKAIHHNIIGAPASQEQLLKVNTNTTTNVVIVREPLGDGVSDKAQTQDTVNNVHREIVNAEKPSHVNPPSPKETSQQTIETRIHEPLRRKALQSIQSEVTTGMSDTISSNNKNNNIQTMEGDINTFDVDGTADTQSLESGETEESQLTVSSASLTAATSRSRLRRVSQSPESATSRRSQEELETTRTDDLSLQHKAPPASIHVPPSVSPLTAPGRRVPQSEPHQKVVQTEADESLDDALSSSVDTEENARVEPAINEALPLPDVMQGINLNAATTSMNNAYDVAATRSFESSTSNEGEKKPIAPVYRYAAHTHDGICERLSKCPKMELELRKFERNCQKAQLGPYPLKDFKAIWEAVQGEDQELGTTEDDIENNGGFRLANKSVDKSDSREQRKAMYGRMLPNALQKVFKNIMKLSSDHVFIDLGHGIGNACLQAAFTFGCKAKGIELIEARYYASEAFHRSIAKLANEEQEAKPELWGHRAGQVELKHGSIGDPDLQDWLTNVDRVFVNNYAQVMSHRSEPKRHGITVDAKIASLFAMMKPGTVMVTLTSIGELGATNKEVLEERKKHGLAPRDAKEPNASFFDMEEHILGPTNKCVSWSNGGGKTEPLIVYKYTRLSQADDSQGSVILCARPECEWARNAIPIPSTTLRNGSLVMNLNGCKCGYSFRKSRGRGKCKPPIRNGDYVSHDEIIWQKLVPRRSMVEQSS